VRQGKWGESDDSQDETAMTSGPLSTTQMNNMNKLVSWFFPNYQTLHPVSSK